MSFEADMIEAVQVAEENHTFRPSWTSVRSVPLHHKVMIITVDYSA